MPRRTINDNRYRTRRHVAGNDTVACLLCRGEASPEFAADIKLAASAEPVTSMTIDEFKVWLEQIDPISSR